MWHVIRALALIALCGTGLAIAEEPGAALTVRIVRPDQQCQRVLDLFQGTRAPHPAAALAAWRRATGDGRGLGKPREALIALFNPEMVREFRTLDEATLCIRFDDTGRPHWLATVPRDDGTVAALATALALSGGASDTPLGEVPVDRLGPPGAPLIARDVRRLLVAGTRADLVVALQPVVHSQAAWPPCESGWQLRADPDELRASGSLNLRRFAEALSAGGCRRLEGSAALEGETLRVILSGDQPDPPWSRARVEPSWLDWVPADRAAAAFALALDPDPEAWNALFALADRVERVDPARAGLAPLRTRLNLLALPVGVRLEADVWPGLRGVSGFVTVGPDGRLDGWLAALHTTGEASAKRLAERVAPALARAWGLEQTKGNAPTEVIALGQVKGRPVVLSRRDETVLVAWGDVLPLSLTARADRALSAGPELRQNLAGSRAHRVGAVWPGRWPAFAPRGSMLAQALAESPPVIWWGASGRDEIRWTGLHGTVKRFLDRLPMEPSRSDFSRTGDRD